MDLIQLLVLSPVVYLKKITWFGICCFKPKEYGTSFIPQIRSSHVLGLLMLSTNTTHIMYTFENSIKVRSVWIDRTGMKRKLARKLFKEMGESITSLCECDFCFFYHPYNVSIFVYKKLKRLLARAHTT